MSASILVIEDDLVLAKAIEEVLQEEGYSVRSAPTGEEARSAFAAEIFEVVLLDVNLPDANGLDLLPEFRKARADAIIVMMTADADVRTAVQSMRSGAHDFVEKPFRLDRFCTTVRKAVQHASGRETVRRMVQRTVEAEDFIGCSDAAKHLLAETDQIARTGAKATVLILGETGTGKELIAKRIHAHGPNAHAPLFDQNCATLNASLLESHLFGHCRGAFTGAHDDQRGLLSLAQDGTLFLDEIGEMSLALQAKLLRVLEERRFKRLGDHREERFEARIVVATNRNLREMIKEGKFRSDLFYRLSVVPIEIPPLRARRDDIPPLLEHFRTRFSAKFNREIRGFTPQAFDFLCGYDWPGNVRELRNLLERLAISWMGGHYIDIHHVRPILDPDGFSVSRQEASSMAPPSDGAIRNNGNAVRLVPLRVVEEEHILAVYRHTQGNKAETARILGITRQTVQKKLALLDRAGQLPLLI
jgi:two-component system response regulator HydG